MLKHLKEEAWADEVEFPKNLKEEVFIKHLKGPLFFGSTSDFQALTQQIPSTAKTVILRLRAYAIYGSIGFICHGRYAARFKEK